jgi:hypothetical protein
MTSWVPGSLASSAYFLSSLLVAVIGKGQLKNRHPKARQFLYIKHRKTTATQQQKQQQQQQQQQ